MKIIILLLLSFSVMADEKHHNVNAPVNNVTNYSVTNYDVSGVATSIANSQHSFSFGTFALQGSLGAATYNNSNALSFGLAKRFNRVLISGSVSSESVSDNYSFGVGVGWRF